MENTLPSAYIFPIVSFKQHVLHGAPTGILGLAPKSGWMAAELFSCIATFYEAHECVCRKSCNISACQPCISYFNWSNWCCSWTRFSLLIFPPHCIHRIQPLDVAVCGLFKQFYASFLDARQISNPSQSTNIYNVANLSGKGILQTPENISSGLRAAGVCPYDRNVFDESIFMPRIFTEQDFSSADQNENREEAMSPSANLQSETPVKVEGASVCYDHHEPSTSQSPLTLPKMTIVRTKRKRRKVSTAITTDIPEKDKLIAVGQKKCPRNVVSKRIRRKTTSESSCDSESFSLSSESDESLALSLDGCIENSDQIDYFAGDYVVCKVHSEAHNSQHFFTG